MPTTVHITDQGNQTISGVKTFDVFPIVSGNKLITGVDLSSYLTSSTASSTYATITNLALTGSTLVGSITSLSGLFTGYTGALDATFASDTQLYTTGSTLDSKINSLSGNLTSTYATITNLATTGSTLDTKINNLSGYINNSSSNIVYSTGDQTISGIKTFANSAIISEILTSGESIYISSGEIFRAPSYNPFTNKDFDINLLNYPYSNSYISMGHETGRVGPSINSANSFRELKIWETGGYITSWIYKMARFGPYGVILSEDNFSKVGIGTTFPTEKVHISGGNLKVEGNAIANNLVYNTGDQIISGFKTFATGIFAPNLVYNTGNQTISGNKNFYGDVVLSGNSNRIGQYHYIDVNDSFVRIKYENGINALDTEENNLRSTDGVESLSWQGRSLTDSTNIVSIHWEEKYLANNLGVPLLTWTGDNIGIGTNIPTEKLQVDGNIRINGGGGLYIFDSPNASDNRMVWQDGELLFELDFDNVNNSFKQAGFLFNSGPLNETALYNFKVALGSQPSYLYIPSGRQGYIAIDSDLVATGSNLNNKINNVSGYINSSGSNIVFTTGNQTISGNKTFNNTLSVRTISGLSGAGSPTSVDIKGMDNAVQVFPSNYLGGHINLTAGSGNLAGGSINLSAGTYGSIAYGGQMYFSAKDIYFNQENTYPRTVYFNKTGAFSSTSNLTISQNSVNVDNTFTISGVAVTPALYVDRINNQIINGLKTFTSGIDIYSGTSPQILRIFNSTGTNSGEFALIGWRNNQFVIGSQRTTSGILRDVTLTGNNININASGALIVNNRNPVDSNSFIVKDGNGNNGISFNPTAQGNAGLVGVNWISTIGIIHQGDYNLELNYGGGGTRNITFKGGGASVNRAILDSNGNFGIGSGISSVPSRFYVSGNSVLQGDVTVSGNTTITGHLSAASKSFLIDHPTIIGKKLQYGSLEGPEHGVFLRGKTNENIINLPNYWPALVDENSISVNLTPISAANNIYVVDYNNSRIITNGNNGNYYFYTVYGERKDIPKLTVEF